MQTKLYNRDKEIWTIVNEVMANKRLGKTVKSLNTLIIRDNSLISLNSSSALSSSDLGTENGKIYVPDCLEVLKQSAFCRKQKSE